jgi:hypothetical protein
VVLLKALQMNEMGTLLSEEAAHGLHLCQDRDSRSLKLQG